MLSVYASDRDMERGGKPHATWIGLPTIDDIVTGYGNSGVAGIVLEVVLGTPLPAHRINTYIGEDGVVGSYDGKAVRIWVQERLHSHDYKFRTLCQTVIDLFFAIIHGQAVGERPLNSDAAYYAGTAPAPVRPWAPPGSDAPIPMAGRTGSAAGC